MAQVVLSSSTTVIETYPFEDTRSVVYDAILQVVLAIAPPIQVSLPFNSTVHHFY